MVSPRTAVPPLATTRSAAYPSAGLAVIPEFPSDPPHSSARQSLLAGCSVRRQASATGRMSATARVTASTVRATPPWSWMLTTVGRRGACPRLDPGAIRSWTSTISLAWLTSHPSPTSTQAATLGWRANPASTRSSWTWSGPRACIPHPPLWVTAKTPSTCGKSRRKSGPRNRSATSRDVLAEQFTAEITAT